MERITLFKEYRLIERGENEINAAWKGVQLLLFFMAFVFGSFCTFYFHMLMYLFDDNCVLFPKLQSLTTFKQNIIYEFLQLDKDKEKVPLEFLSTQWTEKRACYLPTYVPLVSAIFGLVWTTMFLMCSTGSRSLTGLQRSWRVLPSIFIFSLAMGSICVYASVITHSGLDSLCTRINEITGSSSCTYTANVATLAYERRIRGVYQATRLTIISAWLHTMCWMLSALLVFVRVIFVIDFQLVQINVDLIGNIDRLLESHEQHIRTVSPEHWDRLYSPMSLRQMDTDRAHLVHFTSRGVSSDRSDDESIEHLYAASNPVSSSSNKLIGLDDPIPLDALSVYAKTKIQHYFIVKMLFDMLDSIKWTSSDTSSSDGKEIFLRVSQYGNKSVMNEEFGLHISSDESSKFANETSTASQKKKTEREDNIDDEQEGGEDKIDNKKEETESVDNIDNEKEETEREDNIDNETEETVSTDDSDIDKKPKKEKEKQD